MRLVVDMTGGGLQDVTLAEGMLAEPLVVEVRDYDTKQARRSGLPVEEFIVGPDGEPTAAVVAIVTIPASTPDHVLNAAIEAGARDITNCQADRTTDRERHTAALVVKAAAPYLQGTALADAWREDAERLYTALRLLITNHHPNPDASPLALAAHAAAMAHEITAEKVRSEAGLVELAERADDVTTDARIGRDLTREQIDAARTRDEHAGSRPPKQCPETGGPCQHRETCDSGTNVITCWAREARIDSEPEGRTTGRHRDSMG